jgi:hypothetical protein
LATVQKKNYEKIFSLKISVPFSSRRPVAGFKFIPTIIKNNYGRKCKAILCFH